MRNPLRVLGRELTWLRTPELSSVDSSLAFSSADSRPPFSAALSTLSRSSATRKDRPVVTVALALGAGLKAVAGLAAGLETGLAAWRGAVGGAAGGEGWCVGQV